MIFYLIILFLIYVISKYQFIEKFNSHYNIVGYNNISLPVKRIPSAYDNETEQLTNIFNNLFKKENCSFDLSTYTLYSTYLEFPFNNIIKKMIADYLKNNVDTFTHDKIEINADINHLYWKNDGENRLFIFNVNLLNNTHFMTRNIQVKISINNIQDFMNGNDYRTDIPSTTLISSINILCIKLDTDNYLSTSNINGFDKLNPSYYQIKNTLFLMDPFITSGHNMKLTDDMKRNFQEQINIHEILMKNIQK